MNPKLKTVNPFPGLRSFEYEESHLFFGRERHISDLLRKLEHNHFVAIVGTSGSGKSSLVRAGLLPAIHQGRLSTDGSEWRITTLKPGNTAVHNLANSLFKPGVFATGDPKEDTDQIARTENILNASRLGLVQAVRGLLPSKTNLLILLDQFEETFRFSGEGVEHNDADSTQFVNLIIDAVRQRDVPIYVVLTIRSDFLGDCARFEGLPEAINDGHYLVPRLSAEQNKMVITGPVQFAQGKISPRLVQRVISDLGDNPDQLPVLQHALMRTWDVWTQSADQGEPMDLRHYELTGGMEHALSRHADEAFNELVTAEQKLLAEQIFKCLTVKTGENRGVRRPTSIGHLMEITRTGFDEVCAVLLPFRKSGRTFILPDEQVQVTQQTVMDISHESLMRAWDRMKGWVETESESAGIYQRLCDSTLLHREGKAALWRNPELQMGLDWLKKQQPNEAWSRQYNGHFSEALEFLKQSEQEHLSEKARSNKRKKLVRYAIIVFLITVSLLSTWALFQTKEAKTQSNLAEANRKEAESKAIEAINQKQLAEKAKEMALEASKKALDAKSFAELQSSIAVEQKKLAEEQRLKAEQEALRATQQERRALEQKRFADLKSAEAQREKGKADSAYAEKERLRRISLSQNIAFRSIQEKNDPQLAALLALQSYRLSLKNGGNLQDAQLYSALHTAAQKTDPTYNNPVIRESENILAMLIRGNSFFTYLQSNLIKSYHSPGFEGAGQQKLTVLPGIYNTSYYSTNGEYLAVGLENSAIAVYRRRASEKPVILQGHSGLVRAVAFNSTASQMLSGGRDSNVIIWDHFKMSGKIKLASRVRVIVYASDQQAFAACEDGNIYKINPSAVEATPFATGKGRLQSMDISGNLLAVGYANGSISVYKLSGLQLRNLSEPAAVEFIRIDESADLMITALSNKTIRLHRLSESWKPVEVNTGRFISSLNMDANFIYVTSENIVNRYPIKTSWFEDFLKKKVNRNLSSEEWSLYIGNDIPYEQ